MKSAPAVMWVPLFIGLLWEDTRSIKEKAYKFSMKDLSLSSVRPKSFIQKH